MAGVSALGLVMFNPGIGSPWVYVIGVSLGMTRVWFVLFRAELLSVIAMLSVADALSGSRHPGLSASFGAFMPGAVRLSGEP